MINGPKGMPVSKPKKSCIPVTNGRTNKRLSNGPELKQLPPNIRTCRGNRHSPKTFIFNNIRITPFDPQTIMSLMDISQMSEHRDFYKVPFD